MAGKWFQHLVSIGRIFDPSFMKILQGVKEIWNRPLIVTLTLSQHGRHMVSPHRLDGDKICPKFHETLLKGKEFIQRTFNCDLDL